MNSCMKQVFIVFVSLILWQGVAFGETPTNVTTTTNNSTTTVTTTTNLNGTSVENGNIHVKAMEKNTDGMLQRSLYAAIGISALVAIYFIVRTIKSRGRRKAKKYGVIHGTGEMELQPLDKHVDEDEEDMTLFDVKNTKRPK
ncbi:hypothetical protein OS493_016983 [Desmophyllum pertusum]|uniref:Uncharacterized protein n=1 Tax=Desmophyllum pertusum TaxID=174260 RepID=A0A9W9YNU1_9CNID|nr:hypothetical protein OS493_016983 [Desmophyllum pertusum]